MKMTITNLTLLALLVATASCNEKVAPELQNASSSSTVPNIVAPSEYYFSVTNTASYLLNYKLHKTGLGNATAACEVRKSLPLHNNFYQNGNDPDSDITCYLEAEELALYHGGMSLQVGASANTCEYLGYSPFSYYNRMPGDSTRTFYQFECGGDTVDDNDLALAANGVIDVSTGDPSVSLSCDRPFIDPGIDDGSGGYTNRAAFAATDEELCRFNYKDGDEEKCDIGVINVLKYSITEVTTPTPALLVGAVEKRTIKCGGQPYNCIKGPHKLVHQKSTRYTKLYSTARNEAFTQNFEYPPLIQSEFPGTFEYANFRRNLASLSIDYGDSINYDSTTYMGQFSSITTFDPTLMDRYTNNMMMDGSDLIAMAVSNDWTYGFSDSTRLYKAYYAKPLAAEAFLGLDGYRTNPFYTFYCMDAAFDIKARIRLVVRDWDRVFPENGRLELISDINLGTNGRQDVYQVEEIPDDQDPHNMYNDLADWDDIIPMVRTLGDYDRAITIWRPSPPSSAGTDIFGISNDFLDGFFNPARFPNVSKDE
jgi:hypothetical protein